MNFDEFITGATNETSRSTEQTIPTHDMLDVSIVPGPGTDKTKLAFEWYLKNTTSHGLELKLDFYNPEHISMQPISEQVLVKFKGENIMHFRSRNGLFMQDPLQ